MSASSYRASSSSSQLSISLPSNLAVSTPITVEDARTRARQLSHHQKRVKLSVIIAHRFRQNKYTCGGFEQPCINNCTTKSCPILSFFPTRSLTGTFDVPSCEIDSGLKSLESRSDEELNKFIDVVIDLEVIDKMISVSTDKLVLEVLRNALQTLSNVINLTRLNFDCLKEEFLRRLSGLCVKGVSPVNISGDKPSIKMAFYNFILKVKPNFETQETQLNRLAKYFLIYLNNFIMPLPSRQKFANLEDEQEYRSYYIRWMACCIIPDGCKSFLKYHAFDIFGYQYLRLIYPHFRNSVLERLNSEQKSTTCNEFSLTESLIKYLLFPEFILYLEREFVVSSDELSRFWSILSNENVTTVIKKMYFFVEDYAPPELQFDLSQLEEAHLILTRKSSGKRKLDSSVDNVEPFCWSNYLLDEYRQLLVPQEKPPESEMNEPVSLEQVTIQSAKFLLQAPDLINKQFRNYLLGKDKEKRPFGENLKQIFDQLKLDKGKTTNELVKKLNSNSAISFRVVQNRIQLDENEKDIHELLWLLDLVAVINIALPNMGVHYISRLIFDPRHQSLVLLKRQMTIGQEKEEEPNADNHNGQMVIGGITFRPFVEQGFSEVVFVAIFPNEQVKGYGSKMMNAVKDYHCKVGILYLLTYADCRAIEFFVKQGFSTDVRLAKHRYRGYIKDYQGAKLMECKLNPLVSYVNINEQIRFQKSILLKLIDKQQQSCREKDTSSKIVATQPLTSIIPLSDIRKMTPKSNFDASLVDFEDHSAELISKLKEIVRNLRSHQEILPTLVNHPSLIRDPDYHREIPYPMDLNMISTRITARYYKNVWLFHADVRRMFDNHRMYCDHIGSGEKNKAQLQSVKQLQKYYATRMDALGLARYCTK